ncbi:MAG: DUF805 domain-containing protein [Pseudomonadota bacterium]
MELFFSTEGSIKRKQFWIGFVILIIIGLLVSIISAAISEWISALFSLILLFPAAVLTLKRLRDRGRENPIAWLIAYLAPGTLSNLSQAAGIGFEKQEFAGVTVSSPTLLGTILVTISFVVFIVAVIDLGFLKGKE